MAYVVRRPGGRWEIRESYVTERGPRARTLATFKTLSPTTVEKAAAKARTPFEPEAVLDSARRAGAPVELSRGDALATRLLRELGRDARIRPGLRRLLLEQLEDIEMGTVDDSLAHWVGASERERADALVDLLDLADRLPKPGRRPLQYPGSAQSRRPDR